MKFVVRLLVALAILASAPNLSWAYKFDSIGSDVVVIDAEHGDLGYYGVGQWLKSQNLLPMKDDGKRMSVAEMYVKTCIMNFRPSEEGEVYDVREIMRKCEMAGKNMKPGDKIYAFVPTISREEYRQQVTAPIMDKLAKAEEERARLEQVNEGLHSKVTEKDGIISRLRRELKLVNEDFSSHLQQQDYIEEKRQEYDQAFLQSIMQDDWWARTASFYGSWKGAASLVGLPIVLALLGFWFYRFNGYDEPEKAYAKERAEWKRKLEQAHTELREERRQNAKMMRILSNMREGGIFEEQLDREPHIKAEFELQSINLKCLACGDPNIKFHHMEKHLKSAPHKHGGETKIAQPEMAIN